MDRERPRIRGIILEPFKKLNLRRVEAAANDKKLCKLNEKLFKFKCEGVLKERDYIDGKYRDRFSKTKR